MEFNRLNRALGNLQVQADKLAEIEARKPKSKKPYMASSYILKIQEKTAELHTLRKQNRKMKNAFIHHPSGEKISAYEIASEAKLSQAAITSIDFEQTKGESFLVATADKKISIFNKNFSKIESTKTTAYPPLSALFVPKIDTDDNKKNIMVVNSNGGINIVSYDEELHQFEDIFEVEIGESLRSVELHPLGFLAIGLKGDDTWFVYDLRNRRMVYEGYCEGVVSLGIHCDGHILALSCKDGKIRFINLCEGEEMLVFESKIVIFFLKFF